MDLTSEMESRMAGDLSWNRLRYSSKGAALLQGKEARHHKLREEIMPFGAKNGVKTLDSLQTDRFIHAQFAGNQRK